MRIKWEHHETKPAPPHAGICYSRTWLDCIPSEKYIQVSPPFHPQDPGFAAGLSFLSGPFLFWGGGGWSLPFLMSPYPCAGGGIFLLHLNLLGHQCLRATGHREGQPLHYPVGRRDHTLVPRRAPATATFQDLERHQDPSLPSWGPL